MIITCNQFIYCISSCISGYTRCCVFQFLDPTMYRQESASFSQDHVEVNCTTLDVFACHHWIHFIDIAVTGLFRWLSKANKVHLTVLLPILLGCCSIRKSCINRDPQKNFKRILGMPNPSFHTQLCKTTALYL